MLSRERTDKLLHLIGGLLLGAIVLASCGTADSPTPEQSSAPTTGQSSAPTTASAAEKINAWNASPTGQCVLRIATYTARLTRAVYQASPESPEAVRAAAQSELVQEECQLYSDVAGAALSGGFDASGRAIEEGCVKLYGGTTYNDAVQEPTTTTPTAPPEPDYGAVPEDEPGENEPDKVFSEVEWCKFFNTAYRKNSSGERDQQGLNQIIRFFDSEDGLRRGEANLGGRLQLLVDRASPPADVAADVDAESNELKQIARICGGS